MCQHVFKGGETYATPRQLAGLVGGTGRLVWDGEIGPQDGCLCAVDIPATLDGSGLKWTRDRDPMFFRVEG
jgi:hypothetical protein